MTLANSITLARYPLLAVGVLQLEFGSTGSRLVGAGLLLLGLLLDSVDGIVARSTGQTSLVGSVLDIAADRAYELVLWVFFAHLGMLPVSIPLIVIVRTTLTDALRSVGVGQGTAPLAQPGSGLGRFLVGSAWMRSGYSASKIVTFVGLALVHAHPALEPMAATLHLIAWLAVTLCVLRGLPVVTESARPFPAVAGSAEFERKNRSAPGSRG